MLTGRALAAKGRGRRLELEQPRYAALRTAIENALEPDDAVSPGSKTARGWRTSGNGSSRCSPRMCRLVHRSGWRAWRGRLRCGADELDRTRGVLTHCGTLASRTRWRRERAVEFRRPRRRRARPGHPRPRGVANRLEALDEEQARELAAVTARSSPCVSCIPVRGRSHRPRRRGMAMRRTTARTEVRKAHGRAGAPADVGTLPHHAGAHPHLRRHHAGGSAATRARVRVDAETMLRSRGDTRREFIDTVLDDVLDWGPRRTDEPTRGDDGAGRRAQPGLFEPTSRSAPSKPPMTRRTSRRPDRNIVCSGW